jgi:hypothetical protein
MVITVDSLSTIAYMVGAKEPFRPAQIVRNLHFSYTTNGARVKINGTINHNYPNARDVVATASPAGPVIYLPYKDDHITSVRLPVPAPGGVILFYTANMSGCKFFIDTIQGSNDLMVFHANTHQNPAPLHSPANFQADQALRVLNTLHDDAKADLGPLVLHDAASLAKREYYQRGYYAEQQTARPDRKNVEFVGGCTILAFFTGGAWHFYYQTWGDVSYDLPLSKRAIAKEVFTGHWKGLRDRIRKGVPHAELADLDIEVVDYRMFYE